MKIFGCILTLPIVIICSDALHGANFPDKPIQLVVPDPLHKKLVLVEENVKLLHGIEGPVATVAVVGKFHSGKSFLMNQLMGKSKGFGVGPSVRPQTMGIWMWGKPLTMTLSSGKKASIIFLDTEGFAANNVSENYDAKVFAVATLISSHLLYNSVKIIDQADIDYLELLARRTQLFALRSQMSRAKWTNDFNHDLLNFPPLIWVVQDFVQSTDEGETAKEWLRKLMESHTRDTEDYEISLLSIFSSVDCHTLFLPAVKRNLLMDLSQANEEDLTDEYKEEREDLVFKLRNNIVPKEKNGQSLSGRELAGLLEILVVSANEGSLADVPSRWNIFVEKLKQSATEDCLNFYETEMASLDAKYNGGAIRVGELNSWHKHSFEKALELLLHLLHGLEVAVNEAKEKLTKQMMIYHERSKDMNKKKIKLKCTELHNKYQLKAEELLGSVSLPLPSVHFQQMVNEISIKVKGDFMEELDNLVEEDVREKLLQALQTSVQTVGQAFSMQNIKGIESLLQEGVRLATEKYKDSTRPTTTSPLQPKILEMICKESLRESHLVFQQYSSDYEKESVYKAFSALFQNEVAEMTKRLHSDNEVLVKSLTKETIIQLLNEFSTNTDSHHLPLPINNTDLETRLDTEGRKVLGKYEESLEDFSMYPVYGQSLQSFKSKLSERCVIRRQENVEAFTREVEQPLRTAKQIILLSSDNYNSVFSLRQYMVRVCFLQLDEGKPRLWTQDLKSSIVDHFINSEDSLQASLRSKDSLWSRLIGFFQWLAWCLYLF